MKIRTSVMFICMIVVPGLAMFSHHLPADVRATMRSCVWEPVEAWAASLTKRTEEITTETVVIDLHQPTNPGGSPPGDPPAESTAAAPAKPSMPATASAPSSLDHQSRLADVGAVAIDCRPFDGAAGTHVASCRVAVDASGQLHRVFQAAGQSPDEALAALEQAVRGWQSRRERTAREPAASIRL